MYSFEGNDIESLPIPPFSDNTFSTFKNISNKKFKQAKKLSCAARSLQVEDSLQDSPKFSIGEKLTKIYLESSKKKEVRDGSFIRCDYLEKLVVQGNLNHFVMKIFPSKMFCLFIKNADRVQLLYSAGIEESVLLESIDNEEIPVYVLDRIMDYDWDLMYDYHCILKIEKYSFQDHSAQPIFSSFVLLKPTSKLCIYLNNKTYHDYINLNGVSGELCKKCHELEILLEISGPLYLDVSPTALELINLLKIYQSPFGSTSLKLALTKKQACVNQPLRVHSFENERKLLKDIESAISNESSRLKSDSYPEEINKALFFYIDLKEELHSFLVNRNLKIFEDMFITETTLLVEVFVFSISEKILTADNIEKLEDAKYISVFWKNDLFYSCFTIDKYVFNPQNPNDFIPLMGDREKLDKYILKVAEILSCSFTKPLLIQYRNMIENTSMSVLLRRYSSSELREMYSEKPRTTDTETTCVRSDERNRQFDEITCEKTTTTRKEKGIIHIDESGNVFDERNCEKPPITDTGSDDLHSNKRKSELKEVNCEKSLHRDQRKSELKEVNCEKSLHRDQRKGELKEVNCEKSLHRDQRKSELKEVNCEKSLHRDQRKSELNEVNCEKSLHRDQNTTKCNVENKGKIDEDPLLKDNWESLSNIINSDSFQSIFSNKSSPNESFISSNTRSHGEKFIKGVYSIESDSVKTVFEAHPFEQSKNFGLGSKTERRGKIVEFYPSLKSEFKFTKEDFMKDMYHDHSTDLKKLLKVISGNED